MSNLLRCFTARLVTRRSDRGATATEYGLMVSFVALVIVAGVGVFGIALDGVFAYFADWLDAVI